MGFTPTEIIVQKRESIILDIANKDIIHAFDIDAFDVHTILQGGTTRVTFTPNKIGSFSYHCGIPRHTEAGIPGTISVIPERGVLKEK